MLSLFHLPKQGFVFSEIEELSEMD
jgi:hypothetical protein